MTNQEIANAIKSFIGERVYYDEWGGGYIWGVKKNGLEMVAQVEDVEEGNSLVSVRGWGSIQNLKHLPCTPEEFQDHLGQFISDAINEKMERELK